MIPFENYFSGDDLVLLFSLAIGLFVLVCTMEEEYANEADVDPDGAWLEFREDVNECPPGRFHLFDQITCNLSIQTGLELSVNFKFPFC